MYKNNYFEFNLFCSICFSEQGYVPNIIFEKFVETKNDSLICDFLHQLSLLLLTTNTQKPFFLYDLMNRNTCSILDEIVVLMLKNND